MKAVMVMQNTNARNKTTLAECSHTNGKTLSAHTNTKPHSEMGPDSISWMHTHLRTWVLATGYDLSSNCAPVPLRRLPEFCNTLLHKNDRHTPRNERCFSSNTLARLLQRRRGNVCALRVSGLPVSGSLPVNWMCGRPVKSHTRRPPHEWPLAIP